MLKSVVVNLVFLLLVNVEHINGWRAFTINITNSTVKVHSNKVSFNVTIKNNALNVYLTTKEQFDHPSVHVEIFVESPDTGRYDVELFNRTVDSCKLFTDRLYEPLMQLIYGIMLEHGNFMKSCPVKPKLYYIENMIFDPDRFPPYLPERKGYFKMTFLAEENNLLTLLTECSIDFQIKSSALKRFKAVRSK